MFMKPDKIYLSLIILITLTTYSWFTSCTHTADISDLPVICFNTEVLKIYSDNCAKSNAGCHDGNGRGETRLVLNTYAGIRNSVIPFNPDGSQSYKAIIAKWGNRMPPGEPLSQHNRTIIRVWIEQGADSTVCADNSGTGTTGGGTSYLARACFNRDILPVIVSRCAIPGCHDPGSHKEGYNYTTYTNIKNSVTPGNAGTSRLYRSITVSSGESKMPPNNYPPLSAAEIDSIGKWISYGAWNENCGEICDTINPVTFSATLWPIIQASCTGCHSGASPGGGIALASYANVKTVAANGSLMNSLRGNGVTKMPQGGSFSTCRIRQFEIWVNNGSPNN